jgi:hypothetical protein
MICNIYPIEFPDPTSPSCLSLLLFFLALTLTLSLCPFLLLALTLSFFLLA